MPATNHMSQMGPVGQMAQMSQMSDLDGMVMAHPRQMDRLLDGIQATPEQRVQLKQIALDARTDLRAQREAGQALREQGRALFAQPTVDEAAAEALRQQWLARHDRASQRMMQALLEMSRVLTPDQRQAMTALMAERRDRMERQRAERASAAGTKR
jgi:Spy/CpxP family protein refolding chaperone